MTMKKYTIIALIILSMIVGCKENIQYVNNPDDNNTIVQDGGEGTTVDGNVSVDTNETDTNKTDTEETLIKKASIEVEVEPHDWFIRLQAEDVDRALQTSSAQLGVLEGEDESLKHSLVSLGHFTGTYLDIVFVDPDNIESGIYKTNYKAYEEGGEYRWRFTVRSDDANANVLLSWRGLYVLTPYVDAQNRKQYKEHRSLTNPLIAKMKLLDTETGIETEVSTEGKVISYAFNMNGQQEHVFEWIVVPDKVETLARRTSYAKEVRTIESVKIKKPTKEKVIERRAVSFDLSHPPVEAVNEN